MTETERRSGRIELVAAILIGLTSLATIFVSFQASLYAQRANGHDSAFDTLMLDSSTEHQAGFTIYATDANVWLRIQELQTRSDFPQDAEARNTVETLVYQEFSQAFRSAFEDWVSTPQLDGRRDAPDLGDVWYATSLFAGERADKAEADIQRRAATADQARSGRMIVSTVVFSVALFLLGIVGAMRGQRLRVALIGGAVVVDLIALAFVLSVVPLWPS